MLLPIEAFDEHGAIFMSNKLGDVHSLHLRAFVHHCHDVCQCVHSALSVDLLEKSKTPVRAEFGVTGKQEVDSQLLVEPVNGPPGAIPQHEVILVLSTAVVTVKVDVFFPNSIVVKEMMQVAYDCVAALP